MASAPAVVKPATTRLLTSGGQRSPPPRTNRQKRKVGSVTIRAGRSPKRAAPGATETVSRTRIGNRAAVAQTATHAAKPKLRRDPGPVRRTLRLPGCPSRRGLPSPGRRSGGRGRRSARMRSEEDDGGGRRRERVARGRGVAAPDEGAQHGLDPSGEDQRRPRRSGTRRSRGGSRPPSRRARGAAARRRGAGASPSPRRPGPPPRPRRDRLEAGQQDERDDRDHLPRVRHRHREERRQARRPRSTPPARSATRSRRRSARRRPRRASR